MAANQTDKPRVRKPGRRLEVHLDKGDTVFMPHGGRFTIKQTGANGGRVKTVVTTDDGTAKVVKGKKP